jgi:hypothetical protein
MIIDNNSNPYTITLDLDTTTATSLYASTNGLGYDDFVINSPNFDAAVKIASTGIEMEEGCDIKVGDRSLLKTLDAISERLAILETNGKLEAEFDELRLLGDRYRKLEVELKEKMVTWDLLASHPDS